MCGICGKFNHDPARPVAPELLRDMGSLMAHRGPDDSGLYAEGPIGLGHRRLSIIDVAGGHQPIANADGSVWIVFNGEIYNHLELRADLESRGYRYKTHSDTETILHAYEAYGADCVAKLRGMFAFAIWDARDQSLFLARDHFGIKPLYYTQTSEAFLFSSELKALFLDDAVEESLDPVALYDYFTFKFIPGPRTPFRAIKKLPQAHWMRVRDGQVEIQRYWTPTFDGISNESESELLEELEALLQDSVREQCMSEVPLGVFLSGGVDSTLLALLHAKLTDRPISTFAMGFEGRRGFDETSYAATAARACGADHHTFQCGPESTKSLPDILWHLEEPLADAAMLPLHSLCHEAAKHVTVAHCGDGADEIFGGYTRFYWDNIATQFGRVPGPLRRGLLAPGFRAMQSLPGPFKELGRRGEKFCTYAGLDPAARYMNWFTHIHDDIKHQLLHPDLLTEVREHRSVSVFEQIFHDARAIGLDAMGQRQYCELHNFVPDDLMLKSDKIAMSASLEGRFPFLDPRLVEFGLSLPVHQKMGARDLKVLLKKLLAKQMPPDFVNRKKQGFEVPVADWFRGQLNSELREMVHNLDSSDGHLLNATYVKALVDRLDTGDPTASRPCFSIYIFEQWRKIFENPRQKCRERLEQMKSQSQASP
jgi:asparagine synthase (glutamine-hydrolysing)